MVKIRNADDIRKMVLSAKYEHKRIFSITAHVDHGKTTTSDYLLRRAGLMREEDAGHVQMTDTDPEEQTRGITIFTSVVLLTYEDKRNKGASDPYIFQINDTPGHLSFTGEVSRALRGSDGAILLVDALEGVMTQTETNIRLAVGSEWCKPVLFINKVDRLVSELRLDPGDVYKRVDKIINQVNDIIREVQPEGQNWAVSFQKNSVAMGSAKDGWGFTFELLKEKNIKPTYVFEKYIEGDVEWLRQNLTLDEALMRMIVDHLPNPKEACIYRMKKLIHNIDFESPLGQSLLHSDPNGQLMGIITKIFIDPKPPHLATLIGRIFSGTMRSGDTIYLTGRRERQKVKRLGIMELTDILDLDEVPAGNLFAMYGFICPAGETFIMADMVPDKKAGDEDAPEIPSFEPLKYVCEPVVSRSLVPVDQQELAKVGEVVRKWLMADNTAKFHLNKESREYILSGIDPLQIDILTKRINEQVKIKVGDPIIVYRERITKEGSVWYTKSSNGHNRILMKLTPMDDDTLKLLLSGEVNIDMNPKDRARILHDKANWDAKEARKIWDIWEGNMFVDNSKGLQRLDRIKSYAVSAFREWVENSILAKEPAMGIVATFTDAEVHVDPAHTGYNEIASMMISNLALGFMSASPKMYEPIQRVDVKVPAGMGGAIIKVISGHRGTILEITNEGAFERVAGKLPVAETLNIADEFRSVTQGRAFFGYEFVGYEPISPSLQESIIMEIRKRKGMPLEMPNAKSFERFIYARK